MSIYPIREDTILVKENLQNLDLKEKKLLEVGVGNAEIILTAAKKGAEVTGVDINPEAVEHAKQRFSEEKLEGDLFESNLFKKVDQKFDFVVFNPPYLKGEEGIGDEEMWRGGETGLEISEKFLEQIPDYLKPCGKAWIVLSSHTDYEKLVGCFDLTLVDSEKLWFETIFLYQFK